METFPVTQAEREAIDSVVATNEERFDGEFFDGAPSPPVSGLSTARFTRE